MSKFEIGDKVVFVGEPERHIDEELLKIYKETQKELIISDIDEDSEYAVENRPWTFSGDELTKKSFTAIVDNRGKNLIQTGVTISPIESILEEKINGIMRINKEKKDMRILEIYRRDAIEKIEEEKKAAIDKVISEDKIQKIIQEAENQINVMLDRDEKTAICFGYHELLEPQNKDKIKKIIDNKHEKIEELDRMLEKINARLEICDNDEYSKVEVLKLYNILDDNGKIAEYKIEKKGKK
jgi:hypothetical protein